MNYNKLETSLIDVIKEEQAKLGYRKEKISLYYPLGSLNHFFDRQADSDGMVEILKGFPSYIKDKFGEVVISHKGCLLYTSPSPRDATLSRMPSSA